MTIVKARIIEGNFEKPPIFMIHTTPLDSVYLKDSLEEYNYSSDENPIFLLDLPSHGQSDNVEHEKLTFEDFALEVEAFRKESEFEKIHIFGHGLGGFVALHYAIKFNKHILTVVVSNTAINSAYREKMAWNIRSKYSNKTKDNFDRYYGNVDGESLKLRFTKSLAAHFHPIDKEMAEQIVKNTHRFASEAYVIISYYQIPKYNLRGKARNIQQPVLILGGAYDVWPVEDIKKINQEIKQGKLHFFPAGHFPMIQDNKNYWNEVFSWISEQNLSLT